MRDLRSHTDPLGGEQLLSSVLGLRYATKVTRKVEAAQVAAAIERSNDALGRPG